ncbi:hypothetical protein PENSPDRAFT_109122 [Peniophora sp. CONT]|nr:hypothetical protein PENSPDRAFT_109122 [Peniophora sp. CONT]
MDDVEQTSTGRVLTLVQYCQRVAILHADSLSGVGDNVAFDLFKPILDHCSAATLMRVEDASPNLRHDTDDLCAKDLPLDAFKYLEGDDSPTHGWRQLYEDLQVARAKKLEEAESRLRNSRMDEELKRKERDVKLAEAPPMKRARPWGAPAQPKTLFQKTRTEATKTQRLFTSQLRPAMLAAKAYRSPSSVPSSSGTSSLAPSTSTAVSVSTSKPNPRVVVRSVALPTPAPEQNPSSVPAFPPSLASSATTHRLPASASKSSPRVVVRPITLPTQQPPKPTASTPPLSARSSDSSHVKSATDSDNIPCLPRPIAVASPRPMRPLPGNKRNSGSLFMPKHRSYNQLVDRSQVSPPR